jgi:hypothetical protein
MPVVYPSVRNPAEAASSQTCAAQQFSEPHTVMGCERMSLHRVHSPAAEVEAGLVTCVLRWRCAVCEPVAVHLKRPTVATFYGWQANSRGTYDAASLPASDVDKRSTKMGTPRHAGARRFEFSPKLLTGSVSLELTPLAPPQDDRMGPKQDVSDEGQARDDGYQN